MKVKIFSVLFLIILLASCEKYSREKYPQLASIPESYKYINSCYSSEFKDLNGIPTEIQIKIKSYLKGRLSKDNYQKLEFDFGYVLSDKPIEIESIENENSILKLLGHNKVKANCDTIAAFPIYSVVCQFKNPEIGIEKVGLNFMMDRKGDIIKDIDFPKIGFAENIIPIDVVHSVLISRKIPYKNLNIELWFDKKSQSFIWATNTLVHEGSTMGPSCFPEVTYHFKMNAHNGEITEYKFDKGIEYFAGRNYLYTE